MNPQNHVWHQKSVTHIWHPCTQMAKHEDVPLLPIAKAKGVWLYDFEGRRYIDSISSWWVNLFGHSFEPLIDAITEQLQILDHVMLAGLTHEPAVLLAERLQFETQRCLGIFSPDQKGLGHLHFASDGASSTEIALKMSAHYWLINHKEEKNQFLALSGGYHGETMGALGVTDIDLFKAQYRHLIRPSYVLPVPSSFDIDEIHAILQFVEQYFIENHHHIAALIVEPLIQCANQMFFYAPAYLQGLVALCRQYEIHVIADEIAVGMGRTGTLFACEQAGICPDLMCLSKGISGGTLPLSLVLSRDEIYHAFLGEEPKQAFLHSHSYSGNALACRAAVKTLSLLLDEGVLESVSSKGNKIKMLISNALSGRAVKNLRQLGMIIAFDVINAPPDFAQRFFQIALTHQVMIRPIGDTVYIMPSYLITDCEIEILIDGIVKTLQEIGDV